MKELGSKGATFVEGSDMMQELLKIIPNLAALHEDTRYDVFREFRVIKDSIEITVFYREPGQKKYRIDAEARAEDVIRDEGLLPENTRITKWGLATEAIT